MECEIFFPNIDHLELHQKITSSVGLHKSSFYGSGPIPFFQFHQVDLLAQSWFNFILSFIEIFLININRRYYKQIDIWKHHIPSYWLHPWAAGWISHPWIIPDSSWIWLTDHLSIFWLDLSFPDHHCHIWWSGIFEQKQRHSFVFVSFAWFLDSCCSCCVPPNLVLIMYWTVLWISA